METYLNNSALECAYTNLSVRCKIPDYIFLDRITITEVGRQVLYDLIFDKEDNSFSRSIVFFYDMYKCGMYERNCFEYEDYVRSYTYNKPFKYKDTILILELYTFVGIVQSCDSFDIFVDIIRAKIRKYEDIPKNLTKSKAYNFCKDVCYGYVDHVSSIEKYEFDILESTDYKPIYGENHFNYEALFSY